MDKKKKIIIIVLIAIVAALALIIAGTKNGEAPSVQKTAPTETKQPAVEEKSEEQSEDKKEESTQTQNVGDEEDKLMVMYFVSNSDKDKDSALAAIEKVKKEYEKKISFNVINIDEEPEKVNNFALPDETPKIIILGTNGEFAMKNHCADETSIKQEIENILNPA